MSLKPKLSLTAEEKTLRKHFCFIFWPFSNFCESKIFKIFFQLDGFEIRKGKTLKVNISIANLRLFVGNIPKNKTKEEIKEEFGKQTGIPLTEKSVFFPLFKAVTVIPLGNFKSFVLRPIGKKSGMAKF